MSSLLFEKHGNPYRINILRYVLFAAGVILLIGICAMAFNAPEEEGDLLTSIHICCDRDDRLYSVMYDAEDGSEDDMLYLFLPCSMDKGRYSISFPKDTSVYLDGLQMTPGNDLPIYNQGETHRIRIISGRSDMERDFSVYYPGSMSAVFLDMKENDFDKMVSDPKHIDKYEAALTVADKDMRINLSDRSFVGGHGGSTWCCDKKSFEFTLLEPMSILGMDPAKKWTLISNGMDYSNLKNRVVYEAASRTGFEYSTDCDYISLFINGQYHGLYLLTQRIATEGVVSLENDLDLENSMLNPNMITYQSIPDPIIENEGTLDEIKYYDLKYEPYDITGDYLLEFVIYGEPQNGGTNAAWFLTDSMMVKVKSPIITSKDELEYIRDYSRSTEKAIFSPSGTDPESGVDYHDRIDIYSWAMSYLFLDFFGYQDVSAGSLYFYKKRNEPYLYGGPMWDFDKSMTDNFYDSEPFPWYGRSSFYVVYEVNDRYRLWHDRLNDFPDFHEVVVKNYREELGPIMEDIMDNDISLWIEDIRNASRMDEIRWGREPGLELQKASDVEEWLKLRTELFDQVWVRGEASPYAENIY